MSLCNFGVYARYNGATAISLEGGGSNYGALQVRNLSIQPDDKAAIPKVHFKNGLIAKGFSKTYFENFIFNSYEGQHFELPVEEMTEYGVHLENCSNLAFIYCYVWKTKYAFSVQSEKMENAWFYRCRGVGGCNGIYLDIEQPSKGLLIDCCHGNNTLSNFTLKNISNFTLSDNLPYGYDANVPYGLLSERKFNDFELVNTSKGKIIGNTFMAPRIDNYKPEPKTQRNAIMITGKNSENILIEHNIFNAKGNLLEKDKGAKMIEIRKNLYPNPVIVK